MEKNEVLYIPTSYRMGPYKVGAFGYEIREKSSGKIFSRFSCPKGLYFSNVYRVHVCQMLYHLQYNLATGKKKCVYDF